MNEKSILYLTGPVGAGKTSVARELVASSAGPITCIEGDLFWSFTTKRKDGEEFYREFKILMASMTAAGLPFALAGNETIIDFSTPPWFLPTATRILGRRGVVINFAVVKPSEAVCAARAAARESGRIDNYDPYRDLYRDFDDLASRTISSDDLTPAEIAKEIRVGLQNGRFRQGRPT